MKPVLLILLLATGVAIVSWPRWPAPPVVPVPVPARPHAEKTQSGGSHQIERRPPQEVYSTPWAALAAGDHAGFIAALREWGCPEETVRTFALAAVGRIHQERVEQPLREGIRDSKYWQSSWEGDGLGGEPLHQRIQRARAALDEQLSRLLQVSADELRRGYVTWTDTDAQVLPERQRAALTQLSAQHQAERRELDSTLVRGVYGQLMDPAAREQFRELRERQRREITELLGAPAAEQYELRSSPEADYARQSLPSAKDEEEFSRMVAAARAIGVDGADAAADQLWQHLPASMRDSSPSVREQVLDRFREDADPGRLAEIEQEQVEEQRQQEEEKLARREAVALRDLASLARDGGVELTDAEVRELAAAIGKRGKELDREWGEPPANPTPQARAEWERRIREEFEQVAVSTVGERGRAIVEQIERESRRQP